MKITNEMSRREKHMLKLTTRVVDLKLARIVTNKIELAALAELNREYPSLDEADRQALGELNAEGAELKRELAQLRDERKKQRAVSLVPRFEQARDNACLDPLCGIDPRASHWRVRYALLHAVDPEPSIRPAA